MHAQASAAELRAEGAAGVLLTCYQGCSRAPQLLLPGVTTSRLAHSAHAFVSLRQSQLGGEAQVTTLITADILMIAVGLDM